MPKFCTLLSLILLVILVLLPVQNAPADIDSDGWRRTAHGWEHISTWRQPQPLTVKRGPLHPVLVAAMQLLIATGLLVHSIKDPEESPLQKAVQPEPLK